MSVESSLSESGPLSQRVVHNKSLLHTVPCIPPLSFEKLQIASSCLPKKPLCSNEEVKQHKLVPNLASLAVPTSQVSPSDDLVVHDNGSNNALQEQDMIKVPFDMLERAACTSAAAHKVSATFADCSSTAALLGLRPLQNRTILGELPQGELETNSEAVSLSTYHLRDRLELLGIQLNVMNENLLRPRSMSTTIDFVLRCLEDKDVDRIKMKNELLLLQSQFASSITAMENLLETLQVSQLEVSRLENLAVDQWHQLGQVRVEAKSLRNEVKILRDERDQLIGEKFYLEKLSSSATKSDNPNSPVAIEFLNRFKESLEKQKQVEEERKALQHDVAEMEGALIEAKLSLADEKTRLELSNKLVRYYVKHLEVCDPTYIIPLVDRQRIEDLQIADLAQMMSGHKGSSMSREIVMELFRIRQEALERHGHSLRNSDQLRIVGLQSPTTKPRLSSQRKRYGETGVKSKFLSWLTPTAAKGMSRSRKKPRERSLSQNRLSMDDSQLSPKASSEPVIPRQLIPTFSRARSLVDLRTRDHGQLVLSSDHSVKLDDVRVARPSYVEKFSHRIKNKSAYSKWRGVWSKKNGKAESESD